MAKSKKREEGMYKYMIKDIDVNGAKYYMWLQGNIKRNKILDKTQKSKLISKLKKEGSKWGLE